MEFDPKISLFKNARTNTPYPGEPSVDSMLGMIKIGTYRKEVEAVRNAADKKQRDELKKQLHAVTWSGTFSKRNADLKYLTSFSQIICHDIDKLDDDQLQFISNMLCTDKRVLASFISPSGTGIKVLFRAAIDVTDFLPAWIATGAYLESKFGDHGIKVDQSCKDVSRLCFVSFDPELHHYPDATFIDDDFITRWTEGKTWVQVTAPLGSSKTTMQLGSQDYIQKVHEIVTKSVQPGPGTYNAYINQFAIQANRYGLSKEETAQAIAYYCGWADADKDDKAVIDSVYGKFAAEKGKYLDGRTHPYLSETATKQKEKSAHKDNE
ncbi:MAG TPA: BT4734/BF3469 family protein, partial [Chitinophagaceae bacterium]|nr:BT4734/BF3469 family protein [Chitinophagaceae bacterium]